MQERVLSVRIRVLALAGGCLEGCFLSEAIDRQRAVGVGEWWACTIDDWAETLVVGRRVVERCRRKLRTDGFLEERRQGLPAKLFYRVDLAEVERRLEADFG